LIEKRQCGSGSRIDNPILQGIRTRRIATPTAALKFPKTAI
jgi:hypothetical protein